MATEISASSLPASQPILEPNLIPEPPRADPNNPDAAPPIAVHRLNFVKLGLPEYKHKFAVVIDNLFTPEDCTRYLETAQVEKDWEAAAINGGKPGHQYMNTSYRHSGRIIIDTPDLAQEILDKLRPYLSEIEHLDKSPYHTQYAHDIKYSQDPPASLSRLNERLRFLRYVPGQYFKRHCDGCYYTPDGKEVSYYTLQLYLNGSSSELEGGATRFWKMGKIGGTSDSRKGNVLRQFVDIEPRVGRALVFQQHGLWHSGEEVTKGMKLTIRSDLMYEVSPGAEWMVDKDEIAFE
ncbi:2OG-Fe(II) oxygenase family protein [Ceratobasidium sp. AG-Ba]|nr:2OG-Fe(II) oxygenase family protein [Ceratobasidium sp. AG-Ba]QRW10769.1 2OG-Fe(II) oxygenase family protein [Ceratobasidium sp. AG-Ba]